jgi:ferrous iron transport protein A
MGFNEGTSVKLITQLNGDVIVHVKESRVAINKEQARHILV